MAGLFSRLVPEHGPRSPTREAARPQYQFVGASGDKAIPIRLAKPSTAARLVFTKLTRTE
jgi:hypothetical protein